MFVTPAAKRRVRMKKTNFILFHFFIVLSLSLLLPYPTKLLAQQAATEEQAVDSKDLLKKIKRKNAPELPKRDFSKIDAELATPIKKHKKIPKRMFATLSIDYKDTVEEVKIRLFHRQVPKTVANFVGLAEGTKAYTLKDQKRQKSHFYDGLLFNKVIRGFIVQTGCPYNDATGGPGYELEPESNQLYTFNRPGLVSTVFNNGSQFFITLGSHPHLDNAEKKHIIFGEVVENFEFIEKISKAKVNRLERPIEPVILKSVKIERVW